MRVDNQEQPFHPIYNYAVITDRVEGLILTNINTFSDGDLNNNFIARAATWNPDGILAGARHITLGGHYAYVIADRGLVIVDLDQPTSPQLVATLPLADGRASALQFRYLFVTDNSGLSVVDVTNPAHPLFVEGANVPLANAQRVYVARTYAYVAAGLEEIPEAQARLKRLCRGRLRWHQGTATHVARFAAKFLRFQPGAATGTDRELPDRQPCVVAVKGSGSRSRRR